MIYSLLADAIVVVHAAYVAFVVVGELLILLGGWRSWSWVRNPWFRGSHLLAILIVALEAVLQIDCPLTTWEQTLRGWGGDPNRGGTFLGNCVHDLIFVDAPDWAFTAAYIGFALLVLLTSFVIPPRWKRSDTSARSSPPNAGEASRATSG